MPPEQWQHYFSDLANTKNRQKFHSLDVAEDVNIFLQNLNNNNDPHNQYQPFIQVTPEQTQKYLNNLKLNKGTGPDDIRNELIKYGCKQLAKHIATIFNNIFKTGNYPESWKVSYIKPMHKKSYTNDPGNYSRRIVLGFKGGKNMPKLNFSGNLPNTITNNILKLPVIPAGAFSNIQDGVQDGRQNVNTTI